jgi:hypothetical protein
MNKYPGSYPKDGYVDYRHYSIPRALNDWNDTSAKDTYWAWAKGITIACVLFIVLLYGAR